MRDAILAAGQKNPWVRGTISRRSRRSRRISPFASDRSGGRAPERGRDPVFSQNWNFHSHIPDEYGIMMRGDHDETGMDDK